MAQLRTIRIRLSGGIKIPNWMKYLKNAEIGYERINGKRIRFIKFRRAAFFSFGQQGTVWLNLPEFTEGFRFFPNTLQVLDARGRVLGQNIFLCSKCFMLSGKLLDHPVPADGSTSRVKGQFACTNNGCGEKWERKW